MASASPLAISMESPMFVEVCLFQPVPDLDGPQLKQWVSSLTSTCQLHLLGWHMPVDSLAIKRKHANKN